MTSHAATALDPTWINTVAQALSEAQVDGLDALASGFLPQRANTLAALERRTLVNGATLTPQGWRVWAHVQAQTYKPLSIGDPLVLAVVEGDPKPAGLYLTAARMRRHSYSGHGKAARAMEYASSLELRADLASKPCTPQAQVQDSPADVPTVLQVPDLGPVLVYDLQHIDRSTPIGTPVLVSDPPDYPACFAQGNPETGPLRMGTVYAVEGDAGLCWALVRFDAPGDGPEYAHAPLDRIYLVPAQDMPSQEAPAQDPAPTSYSSDLIGRTGITRHGEHIRAVGPAKDPARVSVVPQAGIPGVVEAFTPQVAHVAWDAISSPDGENPRMMDPESDDPITESETGASLWPVPTKMIELAPGPYPQGLGMIATTTDLEHAQTRAQEVGGIVGRRFTQTLSGRPVVEYVVLEHIALHVEERDMPAERAIHDQAQAQAQTSDQVNAETFATYLRSTLIPDLRDSGMNATADDFETCIALMEEASSQHPVQLPTPGRGSDGQGIARDDLAHIQDWAYARAMCRDMNSGNADADPTPQHVHAQAFTACRTIRAYMEACPLGARDDLPQALRTETRAVHIFG